MGAHRLACAVLALCGLAAATGCNGDDEDEVPLHTRCDLNHAGDELVGEWTLTATGHRRRCQDLDYEGELVIETAMPIEVASEPQADEGAASDPTPDAIADAFVRRVERAEFVLSLGPGAPSTLELAGGTVGSCVSFTLTEQLGGDDALVYEFDGAITDDDFVEGDFTGEGPEGCDVDGTFELLVR
jgi:hypothetical protein